MCTTSIWCDHIPPTPVQLWMFVKKWLDLQTWTHGLFPIRLLQGVDSVSPCLRSKILKSKWSLWSKEKSNRRWESRGYAKMLPWRWQRRSLARMVVFIYALQMAGAGRLTTQLCSHTIHLLCAFGWKITSPCLFQSRCEAEQHVEIYRLSFSVYRCVNRFVIIQLHIHVQLKVDI